MSRSKILLVNDDGINSVGLWAAYDAMSEFADVIVVAPAVQQSGVGRSISLFEPLRMNKITVNGHEAYMVGGRPTDCLLLGLFGLDFHPDMVVSGINLGENITYESISTSGTVSAAMEGANQGVPSIAFSLEMLSDGEKFIDAREHVLDFEQAKKVVSRVVKYFLAHPFPKNTHLLNINIPAHTVCGYKVTHLGRRLFETSVEKRIDPRGMPYYWICGDIVPICDELSDVAALRNGFVSITPLTMDSCEHGSIAALNEMINEFKYAPPF